MKFFRSITVIFLLFAGIVSFAQDSLRLEKVVVVSRHGLRAPLEKYYPDLEALTPEGNIWNLWSKQGVKGSELTLKGSALENLFGAYFRMWFDSVGFQLQPTEVYFGASSKQRTIATARSFAAGMLPIWTIPIHYKQTDNGGFGPLDENYLPLFHDTDPEKGMVFDTVAFKDEARCELHKIKESNKPCYGFLEDVLQYSQSPRAKAKGSSHFNKDIDVRLCFYDKSKGKLEPGMIGDLNVANRASDALILMYYEAPDYLQSTFNRKLSFDDMCKLASVKDLYGKILFTTPIIAVNVSHCMLKNIYSEMSCNWHKFTFLCTHDSMIQSLLAALRVEEYELDNTIEKETPIGFKFLLEQWFDPNTCERYIETKLLYQSTEQIQEMKVLNIENPPMSFNLSFKGLEKVSMGKHEMYRYDDFLNHIEKTLEAYKATSQGLHPWE